MMTKQSSRTKIFFKKLAVIPVLAGFTFLFAERVEAENSEVKYVDSEIIDEQKDKENSTSIFKDINDKLKNVNSLKLSIVQKDTFSIKLTNGETIKVWETNDSIPKHRRVINHHKGTFMYTDKNGKVISKKTSELTDEEKKMIPPPPPPIGLVKKTVSKNLLNKLKDSKKYAVWIDGKVINNSVLNNYKNSDFSDYFISFVHKNARSKRFPQEYQASLSTKKYFDAQNKKRALEFKDYLEKEGETKEEKAIKLLDNNSKRKKNLPPPPPRSKTPVLIPPPSKTGFHQSNGQKLYYVQKGKKFTFYNKYGQVVTKEGKIINSKQTASDKVIPDQNITKVYKDDKVVSEFKRNNLPPPPPKATFPEVKKEDISNIPPPSSVKKGWKVNNKVHEVNLSNKSNKKINVFDIISQDNTLNNYTLKRYFLNNKEVQEQDLKKIDYSNLETSSTKKISEEEINIYITTKTK